jgi:protein-tyrosine phosphatase
MNDVFWIESTPPVPLAIVLRPGAKLSVEADLATYKHFGIQTVVSMLEVKEAAWMNLQNEGALAEKLGLNFLWFPIPDTQVPQGVAAFRRFVADLAMRLRTGERIGVHCRGSIGRSTVAAACTLIHLGWKPGAALEAISRARGLQVPDTQEQEDWIYRYKPLP